MPHCGQRGCLSYALGYGGHGVALASWLGDKVGQAMAGKIVWPTLADLPFPVSSALPGKPVVSPARGGILRA